MMLRYGILMLSVLLLNACKTYTEENKKSFDTEIQAYIKKQNLDLTKSDAGVYYEIKKSGNPDSEKIKYQSVVEFEYTGRLLNGEVFDASKGAVEFKISQLIGAWKDVLVGKTEGTEIYLISPPQMAYGDRDLDDIPPNSILIFELKVISVK